MSAPRQLAAAAERRRQAAEQRVETAIGSAAGGKLLANFEGIAAAANVSADFLYSSRRRTPAEIIAMASGIWRSTRFSGDDESSITVDTVGNRLKHFELLGRPLQRLRNLVLLEILYSANRSATDAIREAISGR